MPILSIFFGAIIRMYIRDHNPPHFHVQYGECEAIIEIETGKILNGKLPNRMKILIEEWRILRKKELRESWINSQNMKPLRRIKALE